MWCALAPRVRGKLVAAEGHGGIDALSQFKLVPVFGHLGETLHISQANVMMVVAGVLTLLLMWVGMSPRAMIPGRLQSAAEMAYEMVLNLCVEQIGHEGKRVSFHSYSRCSFSFCSAT